MEFSSLELLDKHELVRMVRILGVLFAGTTLLYVANTTYMRKLEWVLKRSKIDLEKSLKFLKTLLNAIPSPIFYKDLEGKYIECNTNYEKFMGKKREHLLNKTIFDIGQEEYEDIHYAYDKHILSKGGNIVYEAKVKEYNGKYKDAIFSKAALVNENGKIEGLVCSIMDISERKKIEKKIQRLSKIKEDMLLISQSIMEVKDIEALLKLILEKAINAMENAESGSVMILDGEKNLKVKAHVGYNDGKILKCSVPLEKTLLWLATNGNIDKAIIIRDVNDIMQETLEELKEELKSLNITSSISAPLIVNNKLYGILNIDSSNKDGFTEEDLELMDYIKYQVEISITNHTMYEKIIYLSRYDKLTNVYNRRYFESIFFSIIKNVNEFNIVIFDLNDLKRVNDNYGHLAGDEYILEFTNKIKNELEDDEIFARYGGDEFIGIYFRKQEQLAKAFYDIIKSFKENPLVFEGEEVPCSFSFGMANCTRDSENYDELIKIADDRMYKLKETMKREDRIVDNDNLR